MPREREGYDTTDDGRCVCVRCVGQNMQREYVRLMQRKPDVSINIHVCRYERGSGT